MSQSFRPGGLCVLFVTAVLVAACLGTITERQDYKCSTLLIPTCAFEYGCSSSTGTPCTSGGTSQSKKGQGVTFRICVTQANQV